MRILVIFLVTNLSFYTSARKAPAIKVEIEKLLKAGFIYPIPLTEWVSNLVSVDKKQGTIHICTDFHDLNHACHKDNFPTPFTN